MGFLDVPSLLLPLISYHVFFDDTFYIVPSLHSAMEYDKHFEELIHSSQESFLDPDDNDFLPLPRDAEWLSLSESRSNYYLWPLYLVFWPSTQCCWSCSPALLQLPQALKEDVLLDAGSLPHAQKGVVKLGTPLPWVQFH